MKKLITLLILFFSLTVYNKADSSFLSGLEFEYLYEDSDIINITANHGISPEDFSDYLLSEYNTLGEKTALIVSLSSYCEFKLYDNETIDAEEYFSERHEDFLMKAKREYEAFAPYENRLPVEINFLLQLLNEYDSFNPDIKEYDNFAKEMPNSLTVQAVKVIAMGYDIIYNDKRDFATRKKYRQQYLFPFESSWKNYNKDIRPGVLEKVTSWLRFVDDCDRKEKGEELTCYCEINNRDDLYNCLTATNKETIDRIKKAAVEEGLSNREVAEKLKQSVVKSIDLEKDYIESLNTSNLNKAALTYFYLQKLPVFLVDLEGYHRIINSYAFNRDTRYLREFVWNLNLKECTDYNIESRTPDNTHFFNSDCFKVYMSELDKDLNVKYKELGGASNSKLKKAQLEWIKMRDLNTNRSVNNYGMIPDEEAMIDRDILANRVAMLYFYLNPDKIEEIFSAIADKLK